MVPRLLLDQHTSPTYITNLLVIGTHGPPRKELLWTIFVKDDKGYDAPGKIMRISSSLTRSFEARQFFQQHSPPLTPHMEVELDSHG